MDGSLSPKHILVALLVAGAALAGRAQDLDVDGYVDLRMVLPAGETSWRSGGYGKLRYDGGRPDAVIGGALLQPALQLLPDLRMVIDLDYDPTQIRPLGFTQAYLRYRPVSTSSLRWWVKAGMFFAPISQENDGLGWSNPWTITSSALNSWVGEELRTVGVEPTLEWRSTEGEKFRLFGAVFGDNQTAGKLLATTGWTVTDSITPLGGSVAQPGSADGGSQPPSAVFQQIDRNPGWYAGSALDLPGIGQVSVIRYDNNVDVLSNLINTPWHTRFWGLGASREIGDFALLAQAISGDTRWALGQHDIAKVTFYAGYILAAWRWQDWRVAARVEDFGTGDPFLGEHGFETTLAVNWRPQPWLRLTAEWLHVDSTRPERLQQNELPTQTGNQEQLVLRVFF